MSSKKTYAQRAQSHPTQIGKQLLELMDRKKTNLCVSVDLTSKKELLDLINIVGPHCCLVKTHIDIVTDFDQDLIEKLLELSLKHEFLIFEDRKFADIGNTVKLQYSSGPFKIASWAHFTNAHILPGPGIITGLASVGQPLGRGLLLLAEMSSQGSLAKGDYTDRALEMARENRGFVAGFIAGRSAGKMVSSSSSSSAAPTAAAGGLEEEDSDSYFIVMTPGVGLTSTSDKLGQQYRSPEEVILTSGSDVAIVGRGIYGGKDGKTLDSIKVGENAQEYRKRCWDAYLERMQ